MTLDTPKKVNALVVDDDLDSIEILVEILDSSGIVKCESARTGEQAISYYNSHSPDIVFLDIDIPAPDGIETLKNIKKSNSSAKVVMVTGSNDINTVKKAVAFGATGYVVKPFAPEKILTFLQKVSE